MAGFGGTGLELSILITAHEAASGVFRMLGGILSGLASNFKMYSQAISGGMHIMAQDAQMGNKLVNDGMNGMANTAIAAAAFVVAAAILIGSAIAVYVGIVAVKAAADFQQGMNRLVTGAGDVTDNMAKMGQGILAVSVETGILTSGTQGLLAAMYKIISAHQRGAEALNTLTVAAKAAVLEQANVVDVANILSGVMTNYGTKTYNATQFMNGLIKAVQQGKITLQELSVAMGPLDPIAQKLGVSFNDMAAAMTTQTNAMIPAAVAATGLRFLLQSLENPTKKATDAMNKYGLDTVVVANEMKKSLPGALQMIFDAAKKAGPEGSVLWNRAVQDMTGGMRSWRTALALSGTHMLDFIRNSQLIKAAMDSSKTAVIGWEVAQSGFNVQMSRAKAAIQAVLITIGLALLPVLTQIMGAITPIIAAFGAWILKSHAIETAIAFLGPLFATTFATVKAAMSVIIPIFALVISKIAELVTWIGKNKQAMEALKIVFMALGVILAIGLAVVLLSIILLFLVIVVVIAVVVGTIYLMILAVNWLVGAWHSAVAWIVEAWNKLKSWAVIAFNAVKNAIVTAFNATIAWIVTAWQHAIAWIVGLWHSIVGIATSVFNAVKNAIVTAFNAVINWLVGAWNTLKGAATSAFNAVKNAIISATNAVVNWLKGAWHDATTWVVNALKWLYEHNYYYQWLVDGIRNLTNFLSHWLPQAWQNTVNWIVGNWNWLKGQASAIWNAVSTWIRNAVNNTVTWLKGAWQNTVNWIVGNWNWLKGQASAIWNAVSSAIMSVVTPVVNWLKTAWTNTVNWIVDKWNWLKGQAAIAWHAVATVFNQAIGWLGAQLHSLWNMISTWWTGTVVPQTKAKAEQSWQGVSQTFSSAWGKYISGPLNSLGTSISTFFTDKIVNPMKGYAGKAMQLFADGLRAGVGAVLAVVTFLAHGIWSLLGFHSAPVAGPLSTADQWMPNMGKMLVSGILGIIGSVVGAVTSLAQGVLDKFTWMKDQVLSLLNTLYGLFIAKMNDLVAAGKAKAQSVVDGIQSALSKLGQIGTSAGQALINGLSSAISAGVGAVGGAINSIVGFISSHMPHSPAKMGPLRDLNKYGPALVSGFSEGIIKSAPLMQHAMNVMLAPVSSGVSDAIGVHGLPPRTAGNASGITINVTIGNVNDFSPNMPATIARQLTDAVEKEMSRRYRGQWNNASGGVT